MTLTPHFTLDEFTVSQTAVRLGIDNTPSPVVIDHLRQLAAVLERVRAYLGAPLLVSSGYRSYLLNHAIGGSATSAHLDGRAADFTAPAYGSVLAVAHALAAMPFDQDQLIFEERWVHLGIAAATAPPRRELLTAHFSAGSVRYTKGLPALAA